RQAAGDLRAAALLGEVEQELRYAAVDVEQHQAANLLVGAAQPLDQDLQELERDLRRFLQARLEIVAPQHEELRVLHGDDVGAARLVVDQRHLAEKVAVAHHREDDFAAVLADQHDLHLAGGDDVEGVARVILEKNDRILGVLPLARNFRKTRKFGLGEVAE